MRRCIATGVLVQLLVTSALAREASRNGFPLSVIVILNTIRSTPRKV
jgi:hypothetical protein